MDSVNQSEMPVKEAAKTKKKSVDTDKKKGRKDLWVEFYVLHPVYHSKYYQKGDRVELVNEAEFEAQYMRWVDNSDLLPKDVDVSGLKKDSWSYAMLELVGLVPKK